MLTDTQDVYTSVEVSASTRGAMNQIELRPIDSLCSASFQPKERATIENTGELQKEIAAFGQRSPVAVVREGGRLVIGDGHRRVFVLKRLGHTQVYVQVHEGMTAAEVFRLYNTVKKFSTKQAQKVFLKEPEALPRRQRRSQQKALEFLGSELYREIVAGDNVAASTVYSETSKAITSIGTVAPGLAQNLIENKEKAARRLMEAGVTAASTVRKNPEFDIQRKGREYRKLLKLQRRNSI